MFSISSQPATQQQPRSGCYGPVGLEVAHQAHKQTSRARAGVSGERLFLVLLLLLLLLLLPFFASHY